MSNKPPGDNGQGSDEWRVADFIYRPYGADSPLGDGFQSNQDERVRAAVDAFNSLRPVSGISDKKTKKEAEEKYKKAEEAVFRQNAEAQTRRQRDLDGQEKIVQVYFSDPLYNAALWRKIANIDESRLGDALNAVDRDGNEARYMPMRLPDNGLVDVARDRLAFDEVASKNFRALETSIIHVKTAWKGKAIHIDGNDDFKIVIWALAETNGVKIANFQLKGTEKLNSAQRRQQAEAILDEYRGRFAAKNSNEKNNPAQTQDPPQPQKPPNQRHSRKWSSGRQRRYTTA